MKQPAVRAPLFLLLLASDVTPRHASNPSRVNEGAPDASCTVSAEVLTYNPNGWGRLADALEADPSPCADYFIHLPALVADKTQPRGGASVQEIHLREGRFHALAEFHWGSWSSVTSLTWYEKGVEFRRRMAAAGYDPDLGDSWVINELPSSVRRDPLTRLNVREAVRGLFDGPEGAKPLAGGAFVINFGQGTLNFSVYKPNMEAWILDAEFWQDMAAYVRWWAQEVYPEPLLTCVESSVEEKSAHLNAFVEHPAILASAGPPEAAAALAFLEASYVPFMSAYWKSSGGYGHTDVPLDIMKGFVSLQVFAARDWASAHPYPKGRTGFAWHDTVPATPPAEVDELAARLASALHGAYDIDGTAARACGVGDAWCSCALNGAAFSELWTTFESW